MTQPGTNNQWDPDPAYGWITDEAGYKKLAHLLIEWVKTTGEDAFEVGIIG
jgi:hypothetical protein